MADQKLSSGDATPESNRSVSNRFPVLRHHFVIKATGEEAKNYDYVAARAALGTLKTTNTFETVGNFIKGCLGGDAIGVHAYYKKCGLFSSVVVNILTGLLLIHSMHILVASAQTMYGRLHMATLSYPDLAEAVLKTGPFPKLSKYSRAFRYLVDATCCINAFGSCLLFPIIISRTIKKLLEEADVVSKDSMSMRVYIACLIVPCILIVMITNMKYLAPFSIAGNLVLLTVAFSAIYYGSKAATKSPKDFPIIKDVMGFFEIVCVCVFSLEGMCLVIPIEKHMRDPKKFPMVLYIGMSVTISFLSIIGFFGYWGYEEAATDPITMNFPSDTYPMVLDCFLAVVMYVTFALTFWAPFNLVWYYIRVKHHPDTYWCWERLYRGIIACGIVMLAVAFPNIHTIMGILDSFCVSVMGFMIPPFLELAIKWHEPGLGRGKWRLYKCFALVAFGVFLFFMGTYINLKNLIVSDH